MGFRLIGKRDYERMVKTHGTMVAKQLRQATNDAALMLAGLSRSMAPASPPTAQRGGFKAQNPSGRLRNSITHEVSIRGNIFIGAWGTNVKYAIYPEFGTAPHTIRVKNKQWLRYWEGPSNKKFAKEVKHPGIKVGSPQNPRKGWSTKRAWSIRQSSSMPYIRPAWAQKGDKVLRMLKEAGKG